MRCVTKVVVTLLALLGLTGVACRLFVSKETLRRLRAKFRCHHHRHDHDHDRRDHDGDEDHQQDVLWKSEPPRHGMHPEFLEAMRCHERCGGDKACHEGCPVPWKFLEEKCEETQGIMACHAPCGGNHSCHVKCPLPGCPRMRGLVNAGLKCHGACASGNHTCHHLCPKPFLVMKQRCDALQCRKRCGFDQPACRHKCPELTFMEDLSRHSHSRHYGDDGRERRSHGHGHHHRRHEHWHRHHDDDDDDDHHDRHRHHEHDEKAFGARHEFDEDRDQDHDRDHAHHHHHDHRDRDEEVPEWYAHHGHHHDHDDEKAEWRAHHGLHHEHGRGVNREREEEEAHGGRDGEEAVQEVLIEPAPEKHGLGLWQRLQHHYYSLKGSVPWEWAKGLEVQV